MLRACLLLLTLAGAVLLLAAISSTSLQNAAATPATLRANAPPNTAAAAALTRSVNSIETELHQLSTKVDQLLLTIETTQQQHQQQQQQRDPRAVPAKANTPHASAPRAASVSTSADCPNRRPYHTILTAQSTTYQQWQSQIMYFHWKKQRAAQGACTEMEGFTRLTATVDAKPDGLETEIPSIFTSSYSDEFLANYFHFGVLNRPRSFDILFSTPELLKQITSSYVLIAETDHVLMKPLPNLAEESRPAGFDFGYMHANERQNHIIRKYWPEGDYQKIDPVGPSPLMIHVDQLRAITPLWLNFSLGLRSTKEAESVIQGWVQEMWGYAIAAASLGIQHRVVRDFQVEAGSLGRVADDFDKHAYIFHYTYGIEYTMQGKPQGIFQIGEWSLDKRHYGGSYPPRNLQEPPAGANAAAFWLTRAWNEASAGTPSWPVVHTMGTVGWRREKITAAETSRSPLATRVLNSRWKWSGIDGLEFALNGVLKTPWGDGSWGVVTSSSSGGGSNAAGHGAADFVERCTDCLFMDFGNANHNVMFNWDASPPTFKAVRIGDLVSVSGELSRAAKAA